jgi:hypothetical protein
MRGWVCLLVALGLCCVAMTALGDPYEVNSAVEVRVVEAAWGEGPGEFRWPGDEWGMHEVYRYGPFALDDSGRVYIADIYAEPDEVEVFNQRGRFIETIPMLQRPNIVDDLAVYGGAIYWYGQTPWGIRVLRVRPGATSVEDVAVTSDSLLTWSVHGRRRMSKCSFHVSPDGLDFCARRTGVCYPLVRGTEVLDAAEQSEAKCYGLPLDSGARIMTIFGRRTTALSGEEVAGGDIVRVRADGEIEEVLVKNEGLIGVAGSYFLCDTGEKIENEWRTYWVLRDKNGKLLSRTRHAERDHTRTMDILYNVRLAPDGSFYELFVDDKGVHVSRWDTAIEGR